MPINLDKVIKKFQKVFKDTEPDADFTDIVEFIMLSPKVKTPKGEGVMEMIWPVEDMWISEGRMVIMISPDKNVISRYRDRNGEIINVNDGTIIPTPTLKQKFEDGEIKKKIQDINRRQASKK